MKKIVAVTVASLFVSSVAFADVIINEKFTSDPLQGGWQMFGKTNLFQWDSTNKNLAVTWDSLQPNSYFCHPLGVTMTMNDGFCVLFDLTLNDAEVAGYGNELAIGLLHLADATSADFSRATGPLPNLFEFDYFTADAYGDPPSLDATMKDSQPGFAGFYFTYDALPLNPGMTCRIVLIHRPGEAGISGVVYTNGQVYSSLPNVENYGPMTSCQFDALSVDCYADDGYGDSVLAHGTVDNLAFATPLPIDQVSAPAPGTVQFISNTNWVYTLEATTDFKSWTPVTPATRGNGANLVLPATNAPSDRAFYRVRADLP